MKITLFPKTNYWPIQWLLSWKQPPCPPMSPFPLLSTVPTSRQSGWILPTSESLFWPRLLFLFCPISLICFSSKLLPVLNVSPLTHSCEPTLAWLKFLPHQISCPDQQWLPSCKIRWVLSMSSHFSSDSLLCKQYFHSWWLLASSKPLVS